MNDRFDKGPYLLALDESENSAVKPNTESLTGILIPVDNASRVREAFNSLVHGLVEKRPGIVRTSLPELHFSNLFQNFDDDIKLAAVAGVVDLVVSHQLLVFRVSYHLTPKVIEMWGRNTLPWLGIQQALMLVLTQAIVIPVVDAGFNEGFQPIVRSLAQSIRSGDIIRALPGILQSTRPESANLCEVTFADSEFSIIVQMADVVAGLRRLKETSRFVGGAALSPFKQRLLAIGEPLEPFVLHDETIEVKWHENDENV